MCRVAWYLVFRLILADNCSLLCPIFPLDQCIAYPQFIVYDYPFDIFKLFLFSDIVLLIWNMTGHFMEYELCIGLEKKNRECVIKDKHLLTFASTWVHPPPIFGGFCLLGLVHSWLYLLTLIKGKLHSVEQLS
jgi:hypothetical protein